MKGKKDRTLFGIKAGTPCEDKKCPFHGTTPIRKNSFTGTAVSTKMSNTVVVAWDRIVRLPKYERFLKRKTRIIAHKPGCIPVEEGDRVKVHETRPLSKTKHFIIIENLGKERHYLEKKELKEEGKVMEVEEEKKEEADESS